MTISVACVGGVIQSSGPLRYAIVDGIDVRDSRVHNYPPEVERRAQPRIKVVGAVTLTLAEANSIVDVAMQRRGNST
jgi:hypothetical protein